MLFEPCSASAQMCYGREPGRYISGYGFGHGSVTVLVTNANVPPSPLIAQLNGLIAFIHSGSVAVGHSCSLLVSEVVGGSSDPRVGGSSPSGRTIKLSTYVTHLSQKEMNVEAV